MSAYKTPENDVNQSLNHPQQADLQEADLEEIVHDLRGCLQSLNLYVRVLCQSSASHEFSAELTAMEKDCNRANVLAQRILEEADSQGTLASKNQG